MRANNTLMLNSLGRDATTLIFNEMTLNNLYQLMLVDKKLQRAVDQYLTLILSNAPLFFRRLIHQYSNNPDLNLSNALTLLYLYERRCNATHNPIKNALERDGKLITALFDEHLNDGISLSLLANAISRIASSEALRIIWQKNELVDQYYALITGDVEELDKNLLKVIHDTTPSLPIKSALSVILKPHEKYERSCTKLNLKNNFPVNLSGLHISCLANLGDATCVVAKNMQSGMSYHGGYYYHIRDVNLLGANLGYDKKCIVSVAFQMCNLRFAKLIGSSGVDYRFEACDLAYAKVSEHAIKIDDLDRCDLSKTSLCGNNLVVTIDAADEPKTASFTYANLFKSRFTTDVPWAVDVKDAIKKYKQVLLAALVESVNKASSLEELSDFDKIIATNYHFLQVRLVKISKIFKNTFDQNYFSKDTNSWKYLVYVLKSRAITLMQNEDDPHADLSDRALKFLNRLKFESGRPGLFDKSDEIYQARLVIFLEWRHISKRKFEQAMSQFRKI